MSVTIRRQVSDYVHQHAPCPARAVVEAFDGKLTRDQVYTALSQLVRAGQLDRRGAHYIECEDGAPADDTPMDEEDVRTVSGRPMDDLLAELEEIIEQPPVDLVIQNLEEKLATLAMLEKMLAAPIAERLSLIRADLARVANQ